MIAPRSQRHYVGFRKEKGDGARRPCRFVIGCSIWRQSNVAQDQLRGARVRESTGDCVPRVPWIWLSAAWADETINVLDSASVCPNL